MELGHPIARKLGVLVGGVAKKELAASVNQAAELPLVGDRIVGIHFQPVLRNTRKLVARRYLDVAVGIGEGIIGRAQRERALKGGIDETVIDARLPTCRRDSRCPPRSLGVVYCRRFGTSRY